MLYADTEPPLSSPPSVTLTSPVGGDFWYAGSAHSITWDIASGTPPFSIFINYSTNNGGAYAPIQGTQPFTQANIGVGNHAWSVVNASSAQAKINIDVVGIGKDTDTSGAFTIIYRKLDNYIGFTSPVLNYQYKYGQQITVETNGTGSDITMIDLIGDVSLYYYSNDTLVHYACIANSTFKRTATTWHLWANLTAPYAIGNQEVYIFEHVYFISSFNKNPNNIMRDDDISGTSGDFYILNQDPLLLTVSYIHNSGSENVTVGDSLSVEIHVIGEHLDNMSVGCDFCIYWMGNDTVTPYFYADDTDFYHKNMTDVYCWANLTGVPAVANPEVCQIYTWIYPGDFGRFDIGIEGYGPAFTIYQFIHNTVLSPNGNQNYTLGDTVNITWVVTGGYGANNTTVFYTIGGGHPYHKIIDNTTLNYTNWDTTGVLTETSYGCYIVIISWDDEGNYSVDISDCNFTIYTPQLYCVVLDPNGYENYTAGTIINITWAVTGGLGENTTTVFFTLNNGVTWHILSDNETVYYYEYDTIGLVYTYTKCWIHIIAFDEYGHQSNDSSDRNFTIFKAHITPIPPFIPLDDENETDENETIPETNETPVITITTTQIILIGCVAALGALGVSAIYLLAKTPRRSSGRRRKRRG